MNPPEPPCHVRGALQPAEQTSNFLQRSAELPQLAVFQPLRTLNAVENAHVERCVCIPNVCQFCVCVALGAQNGSTLEHLGVPSGRL